jgi:hypothetical protein
MLVRIDDSMLHTRLGKLAKSIAAVWANPDNANPGKNAFSRLSRVETWRGGLGRFHRCADTFAGPSRSQAHSKNTTNTPFTRKVDCFGVCGAFDVAVLERLKRKQTK